MRRLLPLLLFGALAAGAPAAAQDREVEDIVREAVAEFDAGNFEEARALFLEAHAIEPSARLLRGAGMASFELREYVVARAHLYEALVGEERPLTDAQREEVEELIVRAESFVGRFVVSLDPPGATLTVDLRPPELESDGSVLLDVGEHVLTATAEGYLPATRRVTVRGGETIEVLLALEPEAPVSATPPDEGDDGALDLTLRSATFGLTLGTALSAVWWRERTRQADECRTAIEPCLNQPTLDKQRRAAIGVTLALGASAAAAGTWMLLRLLGGGDDEDGAEARVRCAPSIGGVGCAGAF